MKNLKKFLWYVFKTLYYLSLGLVVNWVLLFVFYPIYMFFHYFIYGNRLYLDGLDGIMDLPIKLLNSLEPDDC